MKSGFSVVAGGPRIDCIAWSAKLGAGADDELEEPEADEMPAFDTA